MIRTFEMHRVRKEKELTGKLWDFSPCQGELAGKQYKVLTPCCWENHPGLGKYRGECEYSTEFEAGGNVRIECKGVSHTAAVYLDGVEAAKHYNAYTAFDFVAKNLKSGKHKLVIRADNRFSEESALHIPNDYMSYGGVSRPVVMQEIKDLYIKYIHVTPYRSGDAWMTDVKICVKNVSDRAVSASLNLFVSDKDIPGIAEKNVNEKSGCTVTVAADEETVVSEQLSFDGVKEWSCEMPALYYIRAELVTDGNVTDDYIDRFGFREVKVSGKQILLNGKPIYIKGFCRHEDHPQFGCALSPEAMAADLEIIKDLGANSIRTSHYPNDERFLDLCDEQGILIWEENHARGLSEENMRNPHFEEQAEQVIREMIELHYNHPSIYIWGILNECASESEYGKECYKKQFDLIKSLDSSRPYSFASCRFKTDICFGLPTVVSYNIYPGWYHDTPVDEYIDDLYQWIQKETEGKDKPFLITEIGAGGIYGYRNSYHAKWTEEYQAEMLEKQLDGVMNYKDCTGVYVWQFCDVRISEEWWVTRPRTMNNKGMVDEYRREKLCYSVVKRKFSEK